VFSYFFCLMTEGSISQRYGSGYGSRRPKNTWIRIQIWIRIRNTALQVSLLLLGKNICIYSFIVRYWAVLFENLRRAVDDLFRTCEGDESCVAAKVN
jgi:hypothetical protein